MITHKARLTITYAVRISIHTPACMDVSKRNSWLDAVATFGGDFQVRTTRPVVWKGTVKSMMASRSLVIVRGAAAISASCMTREKMNEKVR